MIYPIIFIEFIAPVLGFSILEKGIDVEKLAATYKTQKIEFCSKIELSVTLNNNRNVKYIGGQSHSAAVVKRIQVKARK